MVTRERLVGRRLRIKDAVVRVKPAGSPICKLVTNNGDKLSLQAVQSVSSTRTTAIIISIGKFDTNNGDGSTFCPGDSCKNKKFKVAIMI